MAFATRMRAMMHQEVAAADVDGLLRGSGQLEDLRQQIDDKRRAGEITHPGRLWETHHEMRFALAYFWVAQAFIAIAQNLKDAADAYDPDTVGYMPRVSHDQALALLRQAGDDLALAHAALADPTYDGGVALPVPLEPRVEAEGRCPLAHLKGMLEAACYLENFAEVEVGRYADAATVTTAEAPHEVKAAARRLQGELAAARSRLSTATGAVVAILNGQSVDEATHEEAETNLWAALSAYVWLGQVVAIPSLLTGQDPSSTRAHRAGHTPPPSPQTFSPRRIGRSERWLLSDGAARQRRRAEGRTGWAEDELDELWENKGWTLSTEEQRLLAETAELQRQGSIRPTSYMSECPFDPVWTATRPITVLGQQMQAGGQFAYNHHHGKGALLTSFRSVPDFEECQDDD
jgi:hypothetical protein